MAREGTLYDLTLTEEEACIVRDALAELKYLHRNGDASDATAGARRRLAKIRALYEQLRDKISAPGTAAR